MKKVKSTNTSIESKSSDIKPYDSYLELFTWRQRPVSEAFIEKLATELLEWAINNKEAYKFNKFLREKRIDSKDFYRWTENYPALKAAHSHALEEIGDRREIGALKKKLDSNIVSRTMAHYDRDYKALAQEQNNTSNSPITVVMQKFPETTLVKKKEHDEDHT